MKKTPRLLNQTIPVRCNNKLQLYLFQMIFPVFLFDIFSINFSLKTLRSFGYTRFFRVVSEQNICRKLHEKSFERVLYLVSKKLTINACHNGELAQQAESSRESWKHESKRLILTDTQDSLLNGHALTVLAMTAAVLSN